LHFFSWYIIIETKVVRLFSSNILFKEEIMTITISAPINSSTGVSITAPTGASTVTAFLTSNPSLAISLPTGGTGFNLTSLGFFPFSTNTAWRLRNGTSSDVGSARFFATGGGFDNNYFLPAGTDTFVRSTVNGTHRLEFTGFGSTKARGTQTVSTIAPLPANASYSLRGTNFDDTLTGGNNNDTLTGFGGVDSLTGGTGADKFVFNNPNQGIDTITDFSLTDNDVINVSATGFSGGLTAGTLTAAEFLSDAGANTATDSLQRFIYDTTSGALFFDQDGDGTGFAAVQIATLSNSAGIGNTNIVVI
jgi:Ca2+-binding RTX toxin-like protein